MCRERVAPPRLLSSRPERGYRRDLLAALAHSVHIRDDGAGRCATLISVRESRCPLSVAFARLSEPGRLFLVSAPLRSADAVSTIITCNILLLEERRRGASRPQELEGLPLLGVPATANAGQQRYARPRDRGAARLGGARVCAVHPAWHQVARAVPERVWSALAAPSDTLQHTEQSEGPCEPHC